MIENVQEQATVVRTDRGLSIAGTRITLYNIMDYITVGWPPKLIQDRFDLTDRQIGDVMEYISQHRPDVDAEYRHVLQQAEETRRYWEEQNRERFAKIAALPLKPEQATVRAKLAAARLRRHNT